MKGKYAKSGITIGMMVVFALLILALIGTYILAALKGVPFPWKEIKAYFLRTDIEIWEVWLIAICSACIFGRKG